MNTTIQVPGIDAKLEARIERAANKRGIKAASTFIRMIITELNTKGYFNNSLNGLKVEKNGK